MNALIVPLFIKTEWDKMCLYRLIQTIDEQIQPFDIVYLVDDQSPLKCEINNRKYQCIWLDKNSGPARARNVAIDKALQYGAKNLFFTDHDCILDKSWGLEMSNFLNNSEYGAVGGMTYAWGKTIYDYYHNINGTLAGKWLLPDRKELWYMPSLNFGMKSEVAKQFIFDESFPTAAGEDVDLCLRLRSKYKIGFCKKAILKHDYGYKNTLSGFRHFVNLFKKYKSSSATLYEGHTVLMWDSSESIYDGNIK